eukprot:395710-Prymnesium_polylepis.1
MGAAGRGNRWAWGGGSDASAKATHTQNSQKLFLISVSSDQDATDDHRWRITLHSFSYLRVWWALHGWGITKGWHLRLVYEAELAETDDWWTYSNGRVHYTKLRNHMKELVDEIIEDAIDKGFVTTRKKPGPKHVSWLDAARSHRVFGRTTRRTPQHSAASWPAANSTRSGTAQAVRQLMIAVLRAASTASSQIATASRRTTGSVRARTRMATERACHTTA